MGNMCRWWDVESGVQDNEYVPRSCSHIAKRKSDLECARSRYNAGHADFYRAVVLLS